MMVLDPVVIEGVSRPVTVSTNTFGGDVRLFVDGRPAPQTGPFASEYRLPASNGGTVLAKVRRRIADPYPIIEVAGKRHRTGPRPSLALRVLALAPLVICLSGLFGLTIGLAGFFTNGVLLSAQLPSKARMWAIAAIDTAAVGLLIVLYRATT